MADLKLKYAYGNNIGFTYSYTILEFNSLATGSYSSLSSTPSEVNLDPLCVDYLAEINASVTGPGSGADNLISLFATTSLDSTNYSDTQFVDSMALIGHLTLYGTGPWRSAVMPISRAFNGVLPPYFKLLILNSSGKTTNASGNAVRLIGVRHQYT